MSSLSQSEANRANALLSTGPRSLEGKAASSKNARTHGLTTKDLVILPDEQDEFLDFQISLTGQIKPNGQLELTAFDNLLHAAWNMRRTRRLEAQLAASGADPLADSNLAPQCDRYARYFARAEKSYYRALRELRTLQADRYVLENANHLNVENISPLVPVDKMAKRSQLATNATIDYSVAQYEAEAAEFLLRSGRRQNEANSPAPAAA
ncbi:MAG: hypothetical protein JJE04_13830 [Acidobacteriia bacterium]|nr:hypothetical protein [Terriglobia bacterium]